jgi:Phospholipase B
MLALLASTILTLAPTDARLAGSSRENKAGWVYVRLIGDPEHLGFQQGYWLEPEIEQMVQVSKAYEAHHAGDGKPSQYDAHREEAMRLMWSKTPKEYQQELKGIADGVAARGSSLKLPDIVYNAYGTDYQYYSDWHKAQEDKAKGAPGHCSAFVATGSATKDGKIVMAHTCWADYAQGEHNNIILDLTPAHGNHILMDSFPGHIDSGDDFAINSSGIMLTETTIDSFVGFDPKGVPEPVRMRESVQYGNSLSDVEKWFVDGNNGAYANMWLIGDTKTNEIGSLELGLKNVTFHRSTDGSITSCNCPIDPMLTTQECTKDCKLTSNMSSDRQARWAELMKRDEGKIDAELGKAYMGDHHDAVLNKHSVGLSTLCGHGEGESRPDHSGDDKPYFPMGSVQGKVVTTDLCKKMSFWARMGHPCGEAFIAADFLSAHPEYSWQKPILGDMPTEPWVLFAARK